MVRLGGEKDKNEVYVGQNLVHDKPSGGVISVGDELRIIKRAR
jgi:hypothetical protein